MNILWVVRRKKRKTAAAYKVLRGLPLSRKVSQSIAELFVAGGPLVALEPFLTGFWSLQFLEIKMSTSLL